MNTTNSYNPGDTVALRGLYNQRAWYVQSAIVVKDNPEEVALAVLPGAECVAHTGYIYGKHGTVQKWDRWDDYTKGNWDVERYPWRANRLLILMELKKYYSTILFWNHDTNEFLCYYINFQLPFRRNHHTIDTLDLDLDLIIHPDLTYEWKDLNDYQNAVERGVFLPEWVHAIDVSKPEIFDRLEKRRYPFDGSWLNWMPGSDWFPPTLPENWDKI